MPYLQYVRIPVRRGQDRRPRAAVPVPVLFVGSHARRGGSERYLEHVLAGIDPAWVRHVALLEDGPSADALRAAHHPLTVIPAGTSPRAMLSAGLRLRRLLGRVDAGVVHANGTKAALISIIAVTGKGIPVVWVKHDHANAALGKLIATRCATVVGVSSSVLASLAPNRRHRLQVISTGTPAVQVDPADARAAVEQEVFGHQVPALVALVGRFDPGKGHEELLAIVPELVRRHPGVRVLFVGGDDPTYPGHRAHLERRIETLELADVVRLLGHRADVPRILAAADVAVLPSVPDAPGGQTEGLPLVGLEALQIGTPVVAYATGGLPELLGECGVLVEPHDRAGLLSALDRLLSDAHERERLAGCGRQRAEERFGLDRMVDELVECYAEAAAR